MLGNTTQTYKWLQEQYSELHWKIDERFNITTIESEIDCGYLSITCYDDDWYVTLEYDQSSDARFPETLKELKETIDDLIIY